jgi:hypothetical protein
MNSLFRLAKFDLVALFMFSPIFIIYFEATRNNYHGGQNWAYLTIAIMYWTVSITNRPQECFDGLNKLGVKRKPARLVFTTGALFASGCAIGDYGDIAYSIGVLSLVVGIIILFWIQNIILFNRDINGS